MKRNRKIEKLAIPKINTEIAIFILLICFGLLFSISTENFFSEYNVINLMKQASVKGIVTIAVAFVFIAGQCDLTVGASTALSAMVCALLMSDHGWSPLPAILMAILSTMLVGVANAFIVHELKVVPFIATLGMSSVIRGLIKYMCDARTIANLPMEFNNFAIAKIGKIPLMVCVWILVVILAYLVLRYTVFGRNLYTVGSSQEVATLSGLNVRKYIYATYTLSAFLCAIAGIVMTTRLNSASSSGATGFDMDAIAAAVVGGVSMTGATGTPLGAALGTILIMMIQNGGIHLGINTFIMESISGLLVIFAVFFNHISRRRR